MTCEDGREDRLREAPGAVKNFLIVNCTAELPLLGKLCRGRGGVGTGLFFGTLREIRLFRELTRNSKAAFQVTT
jgi:hypothetical protein